MDVFTVAGYRREIVITPQDGFVTAALEDDYHAMIVALHHDGESISRVESRMVREPWTRCPGAVAVLAQTFTGVALNLAAKRGEKRTNCTHLHDLTLLAATHALTDAPVHYQIAVSDGVDGINHAEIRRDGVVMLCLSYRNDVLFIPAELDGVSLFNMRDWIAALPFEDQEPARLLQWAAIVAHGRDVDWTKPYDATKMPPNCYNFQAERRDETSRITANIRDFRDGVAQPFDGFNPAGLP